MSPHSNTDNFTPIDTPTPTSEGHQVGQTVTTGIIIQVCDSTPLFEGKTRYIAYKIKGVDAKGEFQVYRRYNDFFKLREALRIQFPGCHIPSIPPKQVHDSHFEALIVEMRSIQFNTFCKKIAEMPHIHYYEAYQMFLRGDNLGPRIDKHLEPYNKPTYEEIAVRYEDIFPSFKGAEPSQEMIKKIFNFKKFLKNFRASIQDSEMEVFRIYGGIEKGLTFSAEASVASYYANSGRPVPEDSKTASIINNFELRQAIGNEFESFIDAIENFEAYERLQTKVQSKYVTEVSNLNGIKAGNMSLTGMFSLKSKEERLKEAEEKVSKAQADLEAVRKLSKMIPLIINSEMEGFLNNQVYEYLNIARNNPSESKVQDTLASWVELFGTTSC